jgi:anaerobic selenocysteine-containing dehydrogenase
VQIATKLNRSQVIHGEVAYILPCLGRIEIDMQAGGAQAVAVEDSTSCIHGSRGVSEPASPHLLSEPRIVAELAKATLAPGKSQLVDWDGWVADYSRIRDAIEATYPEMFARFNERMWQPGGFHRPLGARHREWHTASGRANFIVPKHLSIDAEMPGDRRDLFRLITLRSNGQFNTTVYSYLDRFRGVEGTRMVLFMHRNDMDRLHLAEGERVTVVTDAGDNIAREIDGLRVTPYDIPEGCCAGYYPELNVLIPLWHHAEGSKVPAAKSVPVCIRKAVPEQPTPLAG